MISNGLVRRCVVTGPSRGIGKAIAEHLRSSGYDVVGLSRERPGDWVGDYIACDLADQDSLEAGARSLAELGSLWALVNNAGIAASDQLETLNVKSLAEMFMVNAIAPAILAQAAASVFDAEGGRIVNLCSTVMLGKANRSAYASSKAALEALTRVWALELAPRHITVNAVAPGPMDTEMFRRKNPVGSDAEATVLEGLPVGYVGQPAEIAEMVGYLLSPNAGYTTGQTLFVDGGSSISRAR
jgi:NAD(P)-dependent dehydrogenase (short-subunit alcohol dehydrogenase family)